ncbi:hypothetical protein FQZ97_775820 [compost metagenome]
MMAATLMLANQYSASPKECTDIRFNSVIPTISPRAMTHTGRSGNQPLMIWPPTTASKPTTMTQKYQYSQPVM